MRDLRGKRVLITGAAQGIGRALATAFAEEGAELVLADLRGDLLAATADAIRAVHEQVVGAYELDVTDGEAVLEFRDRIESEQGPIDILVNNAGVVFGGLFGQVPLRQHHTTFEVNALGLIAMTHAFLPGLVARPEAHVVNIASASGFIGLPYGATYAASKWAVIGFSESLRLELEDQGHRHVKITSVCPGYVSTGLFAGARAPRTTRFLRPERLARRIVRGVKRDRIFVIAPPAARLAPFLAGILPRRVFDRVVRWFGINTSMREWQGREAATIDQTASNTSAELPIGGR
jgi:all-trans-retinol dehydrogenase (NAD+)